MRLLAERKAAAERLRLEQEEMQRREAAEQARLEREKREAEELAERKALPVFPEGPLTLFQTRGR